MADENSDTTKKSEVLICIPTYNEIENIRLIIDAIFENVPSAHILVVDDNSPDGTGQIVDQIASADKRVFVLHRTSKDGLGKAYLAAFSWALSQNYQYIFEFDADFSHNPIYLPKFIEVLRNGDSDVVVGSRRVNDGGIENWGVLRRFISWGGSFYSRLVLGIGIYDLTGGFNGFTCSALQRIGLSDVSSTGYCFQIELKYRAVKRGLKVKELPIVFPDRVKGTSKMTGTIFQEAVLQVIKLRMKKNI